MEFIHNYNITIFGDSVTKGLYLENNKIMKISPSAVDRISACLGLNIDNKSVFGQTLKRVCSKGIIEEYLRTLDPMQKNMVVLALGGNDSDYNWGEAQKTPLESHNTKTTLIEFRILLNDTISKLQEKGVRVVVCSLFPIDSKRYFENVLSKKYEADKILQFLKGDVTNISRHQEMFNIECLKTALRRQCEFLDFRTQFLNQEDFLQYICVDGIHPNEQGQQFMSDVVTNKIYEYQKCGLLVPTLRYNCIGRIQ